MDYLIMIIIIMGNGFVNQQLRSIKVVSAKTQ